MGNKIKSNDQAYPSHGFSYGMNIRTVLAKDAMKGILSGRDTSVLSVNEINEIAEKAVNLADKLIKELNRL